MAVVMVVCDGGRRGLYSLFFIAHVQQQRRPRADAQRALSLLGYSSSTARHAMMPPTAATPSAQPAIVKIRRVDAVIIIAAPTTTTTTHLLLLVFTVFTALYSLSAPINIPRSRRPHPDRASAFAASARPPLPRALVRLCLLAADARPPLPSRLGLCIHTHSNLKYFISLSIFLAQVSIF
jgi:hypothetical protein